MLTRRFVTIETRTAPTALADILVELGQEHIEVERFSLDGHRLRLLTDHPDKALEVLRTLGAQAEIEAVLQVDLHTVDGGLKAVAHALGEAHVAVQHGAGGAPTSDDGVVFLGVSDLERAVRALAPLVGVPLQHIER